MAGQHSTGQEANTHRHNWLMHGTAHISASEPCRVVHPPPGSALILDGGNGLAHMCRGALTSITHDLQAAAGMPRPGCCCMQARSASVHQRIECTNKCWTAGKPALADLRGARLRARNAMMLGALDC